ncbi:N-acetylneuraminate synthase family protein [Candidatus Pelagibacter sp.]|uniref:N-acetylneuraminate synthase family protein n=1 Tax=Candidatus Pelagibacter sp. TaxID=2024849 RepID=UPI003D0C6C6E
MTKIIAEIGINHFGSFKKSKEIILKCAEIGVWGVKFQYRNSNHFSNSKTSKEIGNEIINYELKKNYLSPSKIKILSKIAKKKNLKVGISFFYKEDINDFKNFKFDFFKIPSAVNDDFDLITRLNFSKNLFISLGGKSEIEIKKIIQKVKKLRLKNVVFLHCVSNYPLIHENANLGFIDRLKKILPTKSIGYSSHEEDILNCIYVLSKKIEYIERHITLNKSATGLDHSSSSEPIELEKLCNYAKKLHLIDNKNNKRKVNQGEMLNLQNLGKSYYSIEDIKKGERLNLKNIRLDSPRIGVTQNDLDKVINKKTTIKINKNQPIKFEYFKKKIIFSEKLRKFCNQHSISLPIRPHDYLNINETFHLKNYEFHLSFDDLKSNSLNLINRNFIKKSSFTVHLPDYCDENNLIDIYSQKFFLNNLSHKTILRGINFAKKLQKLNNSKVLLIASFSTTDKNYSVKEFYKKIKIYQKSILHKHNILILPQWLPPYAWYFGGSVKINYFSNPEDLYYLKKINLKICMDLSHLQLSCNYFNFKLDRYLDSIKGIVEHVHLSDASNLDGEGVLLGKGDLLKSKKIKNFVKNINKKIVLETWQGHLNDCEYFKRDIKKLFNYLN